MTDLSLCLSQEAKLDGESHTHTHTQFKLNLQINLSPMYPPPLVSHFHSSIMVLSHPGSGEGQLSTIVMMSSEKFPKLTEQLVGNWIFVWKDSRNKDWQMT